MIKQFLFKKLIVPLFRQEIYLSERALIERTISRYDSMPNYKSDKPLVFYPAPKLHDIGNYSKNKRR